MTMTVTIRNDSQQYVARIEHHDEYSPQPGVTTKTVSVATRLKYGEQTIQHATSSRSIKIVEELAPEPQATEG